MSSDCFICAKHKSGDAFGYGVIYEDDLVFASHVGVGRARSSAYLGHVFVETRRHVGGFGELTESEAGAVGVLVNDLAAALRSSEGAEHVYSYVFGDAVPHLHVHLQARYPDTPREYWTARLTDWPDAPRGGADQIRDISARLREAVVLIRADRSGPQREARAPA